jgi:hypothetical protein
LKESKKITGMQKFPPSLKAKFVETVRQSLPSDISDDIMQRWIEQPEHLQKILKDALCSPVTRAMPRHLKTIKLGTHMDADTLRKAMKKSGYQIGPWADDILGKPGFTVSSKEVEVDLLVASVAELGFSRGASYKDVCARAAELGLELCPAEVGPQLRLQYDDQPAGDWLRIAMHPIVDSDGHLGIFAVGCDYFEPCLRGGDNGRAETIWNASEHFVFVRRT